MTITRRSFIKDIATGLLVAAAPSVLLPERKHWFVPRNAPVASRFDLPEQPHPFAFGKCLISDDDMRKLRATIARELDGQPLDKASAGSMAWITRGNETSIMNTGVSPIFVGGHHVPNLHRDGLRIEPGEHAWVSLPEWRIVAKA